MRRLLLFSAVTVLALVVTPALAAPSEDQFSIDLIGINVFLNGTGTGFEDGTGMPGQTGPTPWYYYPNTEWYNQWFYDAPPDDTRWKEISWDINIFNPPTFPTPVKIALNWSTMDYPGGIGQPPLPQLLNPSELEDKWIYRHVIFDDLVVEPVKNISGKLIIQDYNPEWVSIDISVEGAAFPLTVSGTITHECIPAPGAVLLGSIGVGIVGWLRRRRTL